MLNCVPDRDLLPLLVNRHDPDSMSLWMVRSSISIATNADEHSVFDRFVLEIFICFSVFAAAISSIAVFHLVAIFVTIFVVARSIIIT